MAERSELQWNLHCERRLLFNTTRPEEIQELKLGSQERKSSRTSLCPTPMRYNGEKATLHFPSDKCSEKLSPKMLLSAPVSSQ